MRSISIILACFFALNAFGQNDFDQALKLVDSERYEEAENIFSDLLAKEPGNGDLYYYFGATLIKDYLSDTFIKSVEEYALQAEELFKKGMEADPENPLNLVGMGAVILLLESDTTAAQVYFDRAEATIPERARRITAEHAVLLQKMGEAQLFSKTVNYARAFRYLERAATIDPRNDNIFITMGDLYIRQNNASTALFNYNKASSINPDNPVPKIKIGDIYMRVPNLNAARPYFEEARSTDETYAPVYRSLGELYTKAGMHSLARESYERFLELSGNNTPAKIQYGNSLFRARDYEGALQIIEEVIEVDKSRNYLNRVAAYSAYDMRPPDLEKSLMYMEEFLRNAEDESILARDYAYYARTLYRLAGTDLEKLK